MAPSSQGLEPPRKSARFSPDSGQADPHATIHRAKLRAGQGSLVDGKLLAEGEVLEGELTMAAEEEGEDPKLVEQERDHRAARMAASEPTDQPLGCRVSFGEGQVHSVWRGATVSRFTRFYVLTTGAPLAVAVLCFASL
jgi:hypothetical protein